VRQALCYYHRTRVGNFNATHTGESREDFALMPPAGWYLLDDHGTDADLYA